MQRLLFRFDASSEIGIGHAFRCMALIERLTFYDNIDCLVIARSLPTFIVEKINELSAQLIMLHTSLTIDDEVAEIKAIAKSNSAQIIVLDGYQFCGKYRHSLHSTDIKVIAFDDTNDLEKLFCDLVINALPFAASIGYDKSAPRAIHLLGLEFSIIRQEFLRNSRGEFADRNKLLINFGGSDTANLTLPVIKKLINIKLVDCAQNIIVITGGAFSDYEKVQALSGTLGFKYIHNCQNMAEILPLCKMALCAPGAIIYELAYCGVASVFLTVADNQLLSAQAHQTIGWCKVENGLQTQGVELAVQHLIALWDNIDTLENMSNTAQKLIDGNGVERICHVIKNMDKCR